jgi:hypothetical protein
MSVTEMSASQSLASLLHHSWNSVREFMRTFICRERIHPSLAVGHLLLCSSVLELLDTEDQKHMLRAQLDGLTCSSR